MKPTVQEKPRTKLDMTAKTILSTKKGTKVTLNTITLKFHKATEQGQFLDQPLAG